MEPNKSKAANPTDQQKLSTMKAARTDNVLRGAHNRCGAKASALNREVAPTQSGSRADMDPSRRRVMAELKRAARQGRCPSWSRPPAPAAPLSTKAGRNRRLADVRVLAFLASESTTRICGLPGPNCDLIEVCLQRLSGTLLFSLQLVTQYPQRIWSLESTTPPLLMGCGRVPLDQSVRRPSNPVIVSHSARNPARAIRRSMFRDEPLLQR